MTGSIGPERRFRGYGRHAPRIEWPNGATVALNIVINYEAGSEYSHYDGLGRNEAGGEAHYPFAPEDQRDLSNESVFEYESRAGIWRLFRLLEELDLPATVFACAVALERNPEVGTAMRELGLDLVAHGYRWEEHWTLTRDEERDRIRAAIDSFIGTYGSRPQGWYCRYGPSVNTRELIVEEGGFLFDSDAYNDDLPYLVEVGGRDHLVVPYSLTYNDVQTAMPDQLLDLLRRGLDELRREGAGGHPKMMSIGLHPRLVGQAGRTSALREFLEYALACGDVWIAGRTDIARWWLERHGELRTLDG